MLIELAFAPRAGTGGKTVTDLDGVSCWFQQLSPSTPPFYVSITNRDVTGSQFTDLTNPGNIYPQNLNPANAKDLGALLPASESGLGAGTYFIANLTISISPSAAADIGKHHRMFRAGSKERGAER